MPNFEKNREKEIVNYDRGDVMKFLKPYLQAIESGGIVGFSLETTQLEVRLFTLRSMEALEQLKVHFFQQVYDSEFQQGININSGEERRITVVSNRMRSIAVSIATENANCEFKIETMLDQTKVPIAMRNVSTGNLQTSCTNAGIYTCDWVSIGHTRSILIKNNSAFPILLDLEAFQS